MKKALSLVMLSSSLFAGNTDWTGNDDDSWNNSDNWSNGAPSQDDLATFPASIDQNVRLYSDAYCQTAYFNGSVYLDTDDGEYLYLYPVSGGDALNFQGNTTFEDVSIILEGTGCITLGGPSTTQFLGVYCSPSEYYAEPYYYYNDYSLTIQGSGSLNLERKDYSSCYLHDFSELTIKGGLITADGSGNEYAAVYNNTYFTLQGGSITFQNDAEIFANGTTTISGGQVALRNSSMYNDGHFAEENLVISGGSITLYESQIRDYNNVDVSGGVINALEDSQLFYNNQYNYGYVTVRGNAAITVDGSSTIGPAAFNITGGSITNNGTMETNFWWNETYARSYITGGQINGSGTLNIVGYFEMEAPVTQGYCDIGYSTAEGGVNPATAYINNTLTSGTVWVEDGANLFGTGTIIVSGSVVAYNNAYISPGGLSDPTDHLTIVGDLYMYSNAYLTIDFDNTGHDLLTLNNGVLTTNDANIEITAVGSIEAARSYQIIKLGGSPTATIDGEFTLFGSQPLIGYDFRYDATGLYLDTENLSFTDFAKGSNQYALAQVLDTIEDQNTPPASFLLGATELPVNGTLLQDIADWRLLTAGPLSTLYDQLEPSELKNQQIALEEMTFIVNNEISDTLYAYYNGYRGIAAGGYERLSQNSYGQYSGFYTNGGYQLLALTYGRDQGQGMIGVGALETSTHYKSVPTHSSSTSALITAGVAHFGSHWLWGLDALGAYHYINTSRTLQYYDIKARSNHNAYSVKLQLRAAYKKAYKTVTVTPYDDLAYYYGHENSFTEQGAGSLNLHVKDSSRQMLRNALGIKIDMATDQKIKPFLDLAYVYEGRFGGKNYQAAFIGTDVYMDVEGLSPARNYAKVELGLVGNLKKWDYAFKLNGQYGARMSEMGLSASLDRKF